MGCYIWGVIFFFLLVPSAPMYFPLFSYENHEMLPTSGGCNIWGGEFFWGLQQNKYWYIHSHDAHIKFSLKSKGKKIECPPSKEDNNIHPLEYDEGWFDYKGNTAPSLLRPTAHNTNTVCGSLSPWKRTIQCIMDGRVNHKIFYALSRYFSLSLFCKGGGPRELFAFLERQPDQRKRHQRKQNKQNS